MLVSISLDTAPEPNFAVPASPLNEPESLMSVVPSARQKASASSVSTRLHWGQRFIMKFQSPFRGGLLPAIIFRIHRLGGSLSLNESLLWQTDALDQIRKARIAAQRIQERID